MTSAAGGMVARSGSHRTIQVQQSRITLDPQVLAGKPVMRGTRIAVEFVIGRMADGWSELAAS